MKTARLTLAVLLAGTTAAIAQDALDSDGDGMVSMAELQAVYADFAEEDFTAVDLDGDGLLNGDELALARESGMLPAAE